MEDKADLGADLAGEGGVRAPRGELVMIAAEEVGEEKGVRLIGVSVSERIGGSSALGDSGGHNEKLAIAAGPEKVDEEVVGGLEGDEAFLGREAEAMAASVKGVEPVGRVRNGEASQGGSSLVDENDVVLVFAPVDTNVY